MKKSIIHEALEVNFTKKSKPTMNGEQVGPELFAKWKAAVDNCRREFYKYECAKYEAAGMGADASVDATKAFETLQSILDLVGEVNGHAIVKNQEMLDILAEKSVADREPLAGEAYTLNSRLVNARKRLKELDYNGVSQETVTKVEEEIAELEEALKVAKKQTGSCAPMGERTGESPFRKKFEKKLYEIAIKKQALKSPEQLDAEEEARKAEKKARKQAKRQAAAEAKKSA